MNQPRSDALVIIGVTGELASRTIFMAMNALSRGVHLEVPHGVVRGAARYVVWAGSCATIEAWKGLGIRGTRAGSAMRSGDCLHADSRSSC